ncbi:complement C2-like, partial [Mustelus asterias]
MEALLLALGLVRLVCPSLSETVCSSTENISGGTVEYPEQLGVGSVLRYLCPEGKRAYPVSWRVCLSNGRWSPLRNAFRESSRTARCLAYTCVGPTYMEYGFYHPRRMNYAVNDSIEFECDEGFDLIGSRTRTCLKNGRWSGQTAVCDGG